MNLIQEISTYLDRNLIQISITTVLIVVFLIVRSVILKIVKKHARNNDVQYSREVYVKKLISATFFMIFATIIGMTWEISLQGLSIYFASIFAVIGVGLFATWSMLSNVTASVILFFFYPYRIGAKIKIIDKDNSVEGEVVDITLFYIKVKTEDKQIVSYPNNLAIQKPIQQS